MDTPRNSLHLEESERLGRTLRSDPPDRLGESTWGILEKAIRDGKQIEALAILDYLQEGEVAPRHFFFADWVYGSFSYVVEVFGEDAYEDMFRATWGAKSEGKPGSVEGFEPGLLTDVRALVNRHAEIMRGHCPPRGAIQISEEENRFVMKLLPCNSGGRMLRSGMTQGDWNLPVTRTARPWSWGKVGKPLYCCHCALSRGIMASETRGFPIRVHEIPGRGLNPDSDHPFDPCCMVFYKAPELIPEEYFAALGLKKEPSKFRPVPSPRNEG